MAQALSNGGNPTSPSQQTSSGPVWMQTLTSGLSDAVGIYPQFEQAQAVKNSTGVSRVEQEITPEHDNGAAVEIETPRTAQPETGNGLPFTNQQLMLAGGALVLLIVVAKLWPQSNLSTRLPRRLSPD